MTPFTGHCLHVTFGLHLPLGRRPPHEAVLVLLRRCWPTNSPAPQTTHLVFETDPTAQVVAKCSAMKEQRNFLMSLQRTEALETTLETPLPLEPSSVSHTQPRTPAEQHLPPVQTTASKVIPHTQTQKWHNMCDSGRFGLSHSYFSDNFPHFPGTEQISLILRGKNTSQARELG